MRLHTRERLARCQCSRTHLRPLSELLQQLPGPFRANPLQRLNGAHVKNVLCGKGRLVFVQIMQELSDSLF